MQDFWLSSASLLSKAGAVPNVSPIPEQLTDSIRIGLEDTLSVAGIIWPVSGGEQTQVIDFGLLGRMLKAVGDPDWQTMRDCQLGVRIGVGVELPRMSMVYVEKTSWSLPGQKDASPEGILEQVWV